MSDDSTDDLTQVIGAVRHLSDHPQHDHVVQSVGGPQQVLHGLQLETAAPSSQALPTEEVVASSPLVQETVPGIVQFRE